MLNQNIDNPIKALVWDIWNIYEEALKDSEKALALKNSEKEMAVALKDLALKDILALKESEKEMALGHSLWREKRKSEIVKKWVLKLDLVARSLSSVYSNIRK